MLHVSSLSTKLTRSGGIAALSEQQRNQYVDDVGAFVRYPKQTAAFDVWAERVVARTYKKRYEGLEGAPKYEDYFASSILYDEAVASLAAAAWGLGFAVYNQWNPNLRDARGACWGLAKNTAYHVGSCVLEVSFLGETLAYSYRVRARRGCAALRASSMPG